MANIVTFNLHTATTVATERFWDGDSLYEATTHELQGGGIVFVPTVNASLKEPKEASSSDDAKRLVKDWIISQTLSKAGA